MVTREEVMAEIQRVPEKYLDKIYRMIKEYEETDAQREGRDSVMARLRQIRISAAPDFSTSANLYDLEERDGG